MNIKWTVKIINEELWRIIYQKLIDNQMKRRKLNWIGYILCKEIGVIEKMYQIGIFRDIEREVG